MFDFSSFLNFFTSPDNPSGLPCRGTLGDLTCAITIPAPIAPIETVSIKSTLEFSGPATSLTDADYGRAAHELALNVAAIRAVAKVETSSAPFLLDTRPTILFEAQVFHAATKGKFAGAKDRYGVLLSSPAWNRSLYGATGAHQYARLEDAMKLDREAALGACSWGAFQIMAGMNHKACGFASVDDFVTAICTGAGAHLDAFVAFVKSERLDTKLRSCDWTGFARGYNGPGYAANNYNTKLDAAYHSFGGV